MSFDKIFDLAAGVYFNFYNNFYNNTNHWTINRAYYFKKAKESEHVMIGELRMLTWCSCCCCCSNSNSCLSLPLLNYDCFSITIVSQSFRGSTPEWVGWTVTGPSPAEGHLPWPGPIFFFIFFWNAFCLYNDIA